MEVNWHESGGWVVGINAGSDGSCNIYNCYSTGDISAASAGGIVGQRAGGGYQLDYVKLKIVILLEIFIVNNLVELQGLRQVIHLEHVMRQIVILLEILNHQRNGQEV